MSVVINTNSAATVAANNLAGSNALLQRSLNRLSSGSKIVNPADDAGGLAVSMKLSATARRQGAVANNLGNAASFLQTQDGVLKVAGKVLERISELKTLANDPTKNSTDLANYEVEFQQLQDQLASLSGEKFNGNALFDSTGMSIGTTEDGLGTLAVSGIDLLGGTAATVTNFSFNNSNTTSFTPSGAGTFAVTSGGIFLDDGNGNFAVLNAGASATYDGAGNWTFSGAAFADPGFSGTTIDVNGSVASPLGAYVGDATFTPTGGGAATNTGNVASAGSLAALSLGTISSAIADIATHRATNGAQQSRVGFATEVLTVNKANLEAANSRITDVDVASESTQLARYNILVQGGTAMLAQANQSAQNALRLIS